MVAIRQVHDPFGEERLLIERQHGGVGENVIDEVGPGGCGIAEIDGLDRCRAISEESLPGTLRRAVQIDGNVDLAVVQQLGDALVGVGRDVVELIERVDDARAYVAAVIARERDADDLEPRAVVTLEQLGDRQGNRMLAKIR